MDSEIKNSRDWLLIADGAPLSHQKLLTLAQNKYVLVLDGAYQHTKASGLKINVLLGDFDSISRADLIIAQKTIQTIEAPDQNKTDLEKGLDFIDQHQPNAIYIVAATGLRLQHTLFNLRLLKKYHRVNRPLILFSETEVIRYHQNTDLTISGKTHDCVALFGFPTASISTQGLKYEVTHYALDFEKSSSISNELARPTATIQVTGDVLIIHETQEI